MAGSRCNVLFRSHVAVMPFWGTAVEPLSGIGLDKFRLPLRHLFAYNPAMGLNIGGYEDRPEWPKMGPSLLIATCLILAIRTAKWSVRSADSTASDMDLEKEIEHAAHLAGRVLARLVASNPSIFPNWKRPWYQPDDEDQPK
jgi:hypothetical protein